MPPKSITFQLRTINIFEFRFRNPLDFVDPISDPSNLPINLKYQINYRWNIEQNLFAVVIEFIFEFKKDETLNEILKLKYLIEFFVEDLKSLLIVRSKNDFDIDELLETTLVNMAYATGRGILFEKTQGTILANMFLPPVSPKDLILSLKLKAEKEKASSKENVVKP